MVTTLYEKMMKDRRSTDIVCKNWRCRSWIIQRGVCKLGKIYSDVGPAWQSDSESRADVASCDRSYSRSIFSTFLSSSFILHFTKIQCFEVFGSKSTGLFRNSTRVCTLLSIHLGIASINGGSEVARSLGFYRGLYEQTVLAITIARPSIWFYVFTPVWFLIGALLLLTWTYLMPSCSLPWELFFRLQHRPSDKRVPFSEHKYV